MKKLAILVLLISSITSCKKEYNCSCVTTIVFPSSNIDNYYSNAKKISAKLTKKQAEAVCAREETSINETYTDMLTNNGSWNSSGYSTNTTCKVE